MGEMGKIWWKFPVQFTNVRKQKNGHNVHYCMYTNGQLRIFKVLFFSLLLLIFMSPNQKRQRFAVLFNTSTSFNRERRNHKLKTVNAKNFAHGHKRPSGAEILNSNKGEING